MNFLKYIIENEYKPNFIRDSTIAFSFNLVDDNIEINETFKIGDEHQTMYTSVSSTYKMTVQEFIETIESTDNEMYNKIIELFPEDFI